MKITYKNHFGKYLASILLIVVLFSPVPAFACNNQLASESFLATYVSHDPLQCLQFRSDQIRTELTFSDVRARGPADDMPLYIKYLVNTKYTEDSTRRLAQGYPNGTFGVGKTLSRFELTKLALGANCIDYLQNPQPNTVFTDVPTDESEMSLIIGKAYSQGIITGIGDKFYPQNQVTWGETIKILIGGSTYFNRNGEPVHHTFGVSVSGVKDESFRQYAEYANEMGLLQGESSFVNGQFVYGDKFTQNKLMQRETVAEVITRYIAWFKNAELVCI